MLNDERSHLFDAPHMVMFPELAVMTSVLAFNLLGDAWRDWLDPRMRSQMAVVELTRYAVAPVLICRARRNAVLCAEHYWCSAPKGEGARSV
jgi:hypothetical protein